MNTCDTCKWWTGKPEESDVNGNSLFPVGFRECQCEKVCSESKCNGITVEEMLNPPPDYVYAAAGDYYEAEIKTGPKFGCIHWETK